MMRINEIFPSFVSQYHIGVDLEPVAVACLKLEKTSSGVGKSNNGGWQSDTVRLDKKPYKVLLPHIAGCLNSIADYAGYKRNYTLINSWININRACCNNIPHVHPGSTISGVVYIRVPENSGKINFINPARVAIAGYVDGDTEGETPKGPNSQLWHCQPAAGDLLMFPSWLEHYVENNRNVNNEPRISIAFNIKVHGEREK